MTQLKNAFLPNRKNNIYLYIWLIPEKEDSSQVFLLG